MKTIGLIGGMSWESSLEYYRIINETVKELIGGLHSAKSIMYSYDFEEIESLQHQGKWTKLMDYMIETAKRLENAGAEMIVICTNTMHKVAEGMQQNLSIPIIHIADATARKILEKKFQKVGLLGTKFTMEEGFYKDRLKKEYGLEVIIPNNDERQMVHDIIYKELVLGQLKEHSRKVFIDIIQHLAVQGAQGIILGCTEIPLLIKQEDVDILLFDTTTIHARSAVEYALND
ncbi:MAG: aspartate/glutamate racemase family protein [Candidatus Heimdallarchaeota archaeon]|nr:MAG: aspartate/glutamate racemase family protein [Candidatus Heimdallarchaeota archaeon]